MVTGASGFIGQNLVLRLRELGCTAVTTVTRQTPEAELVAMLTRADFVFHLAGVNRPADPAEFIAGNVGVSDRLCAILRATGRPVPIAFASSTQVVQDNDYGRSKRAAEQIVESYGRAAGAPHFLLRLPNVFGKWARPNYNSAVATFCHNIARELPIAIHDPDTPLRLLYIDDAVAAFIRLLVTRDAPSGLVDVKPVYSTTVGEVVSLIQSFVKSRRNLVLPPVGSGFVRALYATYISYLPPGEFKYSLTTRADPRGVFGEVFKTADCGQISYFTAGPGVTRGEHYHHSKTEKFLVLRGQARFGFRNLATGEVHQIDVAGDTAQIVETAPGWVHDITNVGPEEMVVMLWSSDIYDPDRPDTIAAKVFQ